MVYTANYVKTRVLQRRTAAELTPKSQALDAMRSVLEEQRREKTAAAAEGKRISMPHGASLAPFVAVIAFDCSRTPCCCLLRLTKR
jgi:hypothetical protein